MDWCFIWFDVMEQSSFVETLEIAPTSLYHIQVTTNSIQWDAKPIWNLLYAIFWALPVIIRAITMTVTSIYNVKA